MRRVLALLLASLVACRGAAGDEPRIEPVEETGPLEDAGRDTAPTAEEEAAFDALVKELDAEFAKAKVPGGAIAVVLRSKLRFAAGIGVKKRGTADKVTADSLFRVASLTKPLVAMGVMQQVEAGTMDVEKPLVQYVPGFKRAAGFDPKKVLVKHLLAHTSGLPDEYPNRCSVDPSYLETWMKSRNVDPFWSPPGRLFNYSNANFVFAAMSLQNVTGTPFHEYVRDQVMRPSGMETATFDPAEAGEDRTSGHTFDGKTTEFANYDCAVMRSFMGVIASVKDYAHLAETLLARGGAVLSKSSVDIMQATHAQTGQSDDQTVGFGLFGFDWRGHRAYTHDGLADGWTSSMVLVPSRQMAVVVFTNFDDYHPSSAAMHAIDVFTGNTELPFPDYSTPPAGWSAFAGSYADATGTLGRITVTENGASMKIRFVEKDIETGLYQVGGDAFRFDRGRFYYGTFFRDAAGKGEYFALREGVFSRTAMSFSAGPATDTIVPHPRLPAVLSIASRR